MARRVHDTTIIQDEFGKLVQAAKDRGNNNATEGDERHKTREQKNTLDRQVPTRWNSDFACLDAHVYFEEVVQQLTSISRYRLSKYALTEEQWKLGKKLVEVLEVCTLPGQSFRVILTFWQIFDDITKLFSQSEVPLIYEVIPIMEALEHNLDAIRGSESFPAVIRIAAHAALLVLGKYYAHTDDCEVYGTSIGTSCVALSVSAVHDQCMLVMCPHRKMVWLRKNPDWDDEGRAMVENCVRNRWNETFKGDDVDLEAASQEAAKAKVSYTST